MFKMKKEIKTGILVILLLVAVTALTFSFNLPFKEAKVSENKDIIQNSPVEGIEQYEGDLRQITCYCGCEHTDLYNCYEENMLTDCGLCMKEYDTYLEMKDQHSIQEISDYIDNKWGKEVEE